MVSERENLKPASKDKQAVAKFCAGDFMPTEERCAEVLKEMRWKMGVRCPRCHSKRVKRHGKCRKYYDRYLCRECGRTFNDLTGTVFEGAKIEVREFVYAAKRLLERESMNQTSKELGRCFRTVMRVRDLMSDVLAKKLVKKLEDEVEVDETYVSAGQKGTKCTHREPRKRGLKRRGRGTYDKDKPPIVALVQRGGAVILRVPKKLGRSFIRKLLNECVKKGSNVYTDDFPMYRDLDGYRHRRVNHSGGEYVKGKVHTNTAEGIFSMVKSWLRGYRGVRKDRLWRLLKILEFRFNLRDLNPFDRLSTLFGFLL